MGSLSDFFLPFRQQIIGINQTFVSPYGPQALLYGDWTASGRLYGPIEDRLRNQIGPYVANTHTETTVTGRVMTQAYHEARHLIKEQVNAGEDDVLLFTGSGMTGAINKLQRIMGLRIPERAMHFAAQREFAGVGEQHISHRSPFPMQEENKPVVFITHMEHHSNPTSWLETFVDLEIINHTEEGLVDLHHFEELLDQYRHRKLKIASITACSNITGIQPPYQEMAKLIHADGGYIWVDFACSGPYVEVNMNPEEAGAHLDAVFFSPHKFLGGPGTPGVLLFKGCLYENQVPDQPGGGTVVYTNPWHGRRYVKDIEAREDGGTPPFLQSIKAAMAFQLKAKMNPAKMYAREEELLARLFPLLEKIDGLIIIAAEHKKRLGVISFTVPGLHYNLAVQLLNDRFGIQTRGGCACAGTYGHFLFNIDQRTSALIETEILSGNLMRRPGFIRLSIHPTWLDEEVTVVADAIRQVVENHEEWGKDYSYHADTNEFVHWNTATYTRQTTMVDSWFRL